MLLCILLLVLNALHLHWQQINLSLIRRIRFPTLSLQALDSSVMYILDKLHKISHNKANLLFIMAL